MAQYNFVQYSLQDAHLLFKSRRKDYCLSTEKQLKSFSLLLLLLLYYLAPIALCTSHTEDGPVGEDNEQSIEG